MVARKDIQLSCAGISGIASHSLSWQPMQRLQIIYSLVQSGTFMLSPCVWPPERPGGIHALEGGCWQSISTLLPLQARGRHISTLTLIVTLSGVWSRSCPEDQDPGFRVLRGEEAGIKTEAFLQEYLGFRTDGHVMSGKWVMGLG